jgi:hypothetical protein
LSQSEIDELMILMRDWFLEFYRSGGDSKTIEELQRMLGRRRDARNIQTEIRFVRQEVIYAENGVPMNQIVYDQRLVYEDPVGGDVDFRDASSINDEEADNSINIDGLVPGEIATLPFDDIEANLGLATTLTENIEALKEVQIPLSVPVVPVQEQEQPLTVDQSREDEDRWTPSPTAVSAMIVALGIMVSAGSFYLYDRRLAATMHY